MTNDKNAIENYLGKMEEIKLSDGWVAATYQTQRRIEAHLEFLCHLGLSELTTKAEQADKIGELVSKIERAYLMDKPPGAKKK